MKENDSLITDLPNKIELQSHRIPMLKLSFGLLY